MADAEIGSVHRASSITDDVAKNAGFYAGVLGMRLIFKIWKGKLSK